MEPGTSMLPWETRAGIRLIKRRNNMDFGLYKDGKLVFQGSEKECYVELQKRQSQSCYFAMKYNGWTIKNLEQGNSHV